MSQPATLSWFARHEVRLFWRDWIAMLTAGKRNRESLIGVMAIAFFVFIHLLAHYLVSPLAEGGVVLDKTTMIFVTSSVFLYCTMMISQAMESVTRAFYARSDLDLILSSPISARRIFTVRILAIAVATVLLTTVLAGPFINAFAYIDGPRWLAGYGVIFGLAGLCTAFAVLLTVGLFRTLGPKRTRLISQVVSAVIGAAFVIGIQAAAILSTGSLSRFSFLGSERIVDAVPPLTSWVWWPAFAAAGDIEILLGLIGVGLAALALTILLCAKNFGEHVVAASGVAFESSASRPRLSAFRQASVKRTLRRKEWTLLRRDPWLMSQTLMQILYLFPPALLLWRNFGDSVGPLVILTPVLVMASGQLAGGLAWLAVSGEDAPDLMTSAPVSAPMIMGAKIEAVLGSVLIVVLPLLAALTLASVKLAAITAAGIVVSACSATMIQIWFRAQAKRSDFRRRQTSSRLATLAEALSSIFWASAAALIAAAYFNYAAATAFLAVLTLVCAWAVRPRRTAET